MGWALDVFNEAGKALLILGAPGAGKTTLLLELTRDLLNQAEQNEDYLIPVLFNLSSWAERQLPLTNWLMDELIKRYDVPRKIAKNWLESELVLPLLDGLDEVALTCREACVTAINDFINQHGLLPIAVCSRVADYEALSTRLRLPSAVVVQSLTQQQVQQHLGQAGERLSGLATALKTDAALWELLNTPLMLSIATQAYQNCPVSDIQITGSLKEQRRNLFAKYTDVMFKRRGAKFPYTQEQTFHWLSWLATAMEQHKQSIFYLEWLQPDYLSIPKQQHMVTEGAGALCGLVLYSTIILGEELNNLLGIFLFYALIFTIGGISFGFERKIQPSEVLDFQWSRIYEYMVSSFIFAIFLGILTVLWGGIKGIFSWLMLKLGNLIDYLLDTHVSTYFRSEDIKLIYRFQHIDSVLEMLYMVSYSFLYVGILVSLYVIFKTNTITTRVIPNEGIQRSLKNSLFIGIVIIFFCRIFFNYINFYPFY